MLNKYSLCLLPTLLGVFAPLLITGTALAECRELRVNGTNDWFPVMIREENTNNLSGILPDLAVEIGSQLDIQIIPQPQVSWKSLFLQMEQGELDVIMGVYWTQDRANRFLYSKPVLQDEVAIFVRKGREFPLQRLEDLVGRVGLRPQGGSYGESFDSFAKENLLFKHVPSRDRNKIMRMLASDVADYAVLGRFDGLEDIQSSGYQGEIVDLPWAVTSNGVHFLFSGHTECAGLVEDFNKEIGRMMKDGTIAKLEQKYIIR
ncbi:substrate-binding periplasmic protein [Aestuariispira insulae]|uniref:substrate-binding periplasmic protein n=1 Tax=Aestuariispira insulae TaxID=1461337 RepID=UPI001FEA0945|nr:transporter substrate-binding domain-containing protein [Aestuariispira insulae]